MLFGENLLLVYMDVSENRSTPNSSIHFNRVFNYKPSILGYPLFMETPIQLIGGKISRPSHDFNIPLDRDDEMAILSC